MFNFILKVASISMFMLFLNCFDFNTVEKVQIQDVVADVKGNLIEFNTANVNDIGRAINSNIDVLDELIIKIDKAKDYEKVFPIILSSVEKISANYNDISSKKELIRETLMRRVNDIKKQRALALEKIGFIDNKINRTKMDIANERTDYRKTALETTLKFQIQERDVWQRFVTGMRFTELINNLTDASGGINKFIDILDANSMVYNQAVITLKAIQSYKNASKDLQEVLAVVNLGNDLIASWDKLSLVLDGAMERVETIENFDFNSPITEPITTDSTKVN